MHAGDSGREGEYIQRLVFMMAKPNPNAKMKRVWIDSQTEEEILRGIKEAKNLSEYDSLSDSAYLRAKEDYLIGINFSRLLSIIYGRTLASKINEEKASISVGRVMTCVLGMIVSREREIRNFVKTKYYKIIGTFGNENSMIKAEWKSNEKSKMFNSPLLYNETGFKKEKDAKDFAYLRAKEDYLIGINFSRLLSIIYGRTLASKINEEKASISVGRVMTCVLGMIVSREREIRNFVKTKYYKIIGTFGNENSMIKAEWKSNEKSKMFNSPLLYNETGFKKEKDAKDFIANLQGKNAIVTELKKSKQKENPPLLFNLAEVQNQCTKKFKIKPDETLEIIQNLYEKKLVTYPRTDARVLSTAVAKEITKNLNGIARGFKDEKVQGYIKKMVDEKYSTNLLKTKYVNDSKITDHYAIIPTGQGYENYNNLLELHKNVYKLIVERFLAIFYPPAEYQKIQLTLEIKNDDNTVETFNCSEKVCIKEGFLEITKAGNRKKESNLENDNEEVQENNLEILKKLKKGQELETQNFELKEAETSPPSRYNSGSIILAMENAGKLIEDEELREQIKGAGIGTSATRAEIIKKLEKIKYININGKTQIITPTLKGETIYDIVLKSMPDMLNPKLTASWEKGLDLVAKKEIEPSEFMTKLKNYINSKFNKLVIKM